MDNFETDSAEEYRGILENNHIPHYEFNISKHYLCALEYEGEAENLNPEDVTALRKFIETLPEAVTHFDFKELENTNFTTCEICNLKSDCATVFGIIKRESIN